MVVRAANAVDHMIREGVQVDFITANTDAQALSVLPGAPLKVQLGKTGLGGSEAGRAAAQESRMHRRGPEGAHVASSPPAWAVASARRSGGGRIAGERAS